MTQCESEHYVRDEGFYNCELKKGHRGQHEYTKVIWWDD